MQRYLPPLREEIDATALVGGAVVVAAVYVLTDLDGLALGMIVGIAVGAPIAGAFLEAFEIGPSTAGIAFGSLLGVAGGAVALRGSVPTGTLVAAIGAWFLLDAVCDWRVDERPAPPGPLHREPGPAGLVRDALRRLARPFRLFDPR